MHGQGAVIDLDEKLSRFTEHWSPKLVATFNGHNATVVKVHGEFPWHHHEGEDEFFLTLHGEFIVRLRDRELRLRPGQCVVVPRGVEHQTAAEVETAILYVSMQGARHAGNVETDRAVEHFEPI